MDTLIKTLKDELVYDEEVDNWFLIQSWVPIVSIVIAYLAFVYYFGPRWMADRKPYNLQSIILFYNFVQTLYNGYIVSLIFTTPGAIPYLYKHSCTPLSNRKANPLWPYFVWSCYLYFLSKLVDLLDTVFFVLRKKKSQISFLHVYHHASMVLATWAFIRYYKGEQAVYIGFLNSLVHVVMYSYYFLSCLGPQVQKHLWWKKYITRFQLTQFVFFIVHQSSLIIFNCKQPIALTYYAISQAILMVILFGNFYYHTYVVKKIKIK